MSSCGDWDCIKINLGARFMFKRACRGICLVGGCMRRPQTREDEFVSEVRG
jgi:hypothetical protein